MAQRNAKYTAVAKKGGEENLEMGKHPKGKGFALKMETVDKLWT